MDGVLAARGAVSEVQLDALLVHAAEQLILTVFRHRQLLQSHRLPSQKRLRWPGTSTVFNVAEAVRVRQCGLIEEKKMRVFRKAR